MLKIISLKLSYTNVMHFLLGSFVLLFKMTNMLKKIVATVQMNYRKCTIHRPLFPIYIAHAKRRVFDREMLTTF